MGGYQATKGDMLDEMLGRYINEANCQVPIKKLGDGWYLFGTRRIFARIQVGKLIIRVGGGWMKIDEFIEKHADEEMAKLQRLRDSGTDPHADPVRKSTATISNDRMNGIHRGKTVNVSHS